MKILSYAFRIQCAGVESKQQNSTNHHRPHYVLRSLSSQFVFLRWALHIKPHHAFRAWRLFSKCAIIQLLLGGPDLATPSAAWREKLAPSAPPQAGDRALVCHRHGEPADLPSAPNYRRFQQGELHPSLPARFFSVRRSMKGREGGGGRGEGGGKGKRLCVCARNG